ncbi:MAG: hypothetical protein ABWY77_06210 [Acidimicrobiia bacterium]
MWRLRYFFVVLWAALCGFVAAAVVGALAQVVFDIETSWFWPVSIVLQALAFVLTMGAVFSWRATHAKPRRRAHPDEPVMTTAGRVVGSWIGRRR